MSSFFRTPLGPYGEVFERYHFTCVYCGFDGRLFDNWMQLTIDHVHPRSSGGDDSSENIVIACSSCNSITSRMKFLPSATKNEILQEKRARVEQRRKRFYDLWLETVAPLYLERPLPPIM